MKLSSHKFRYVAFALILADVTLVILLRTFGSIGFAALVATVFFCGIVCLLLHVLARIAERTPYGGTGDDAWEAEGLGSYGNVLHGGQGG